MLVYLFISVFLSKMFTWNICWGVYSVLCFTNMSVGSLKLYGSFGVNGKHICVAKWIGGCALSYHQDQNWKLCSFSRLQNNAWIECDVST